MTPVGARLLTYRLPLVTPLNWGGVKQTERCGAIIEVRFKSGDLGWGEIAPLPGFSQESLSGAVDDAISSLTDRLSGRLCEARTPSAQFAIDCALNRVELFSGSIPSVPLLSGEETQLIERIDTWQASHILPTRAKLKVGVQSPEQDATRFNRLCQLLPNCQFRLDANRQWSTKQACFFLSQVNTQRIAFIEEPCETLSKSYQLVENTRCPLALDESLQFAENQSLLTDFLDKPVPQLAAFVIKPTLVGGFKRCKALIDWATQHSCEVIVSSSVESHLAIQQLATLATKWSPKTTPGLDTLQLLPSHQFIKGKQLDEARLTCVWHR